MICRLLLICLLVLPAAAQPIPDTLWTRQFGGVEVNFGRSVIQTNEGSFLIGAYSNRSGYSSDVHLIKINPTGNFLWERFAGGVDAEECYMVRQTADGGYIAVGTTRTYGAGAYDLYAVRTGAAGDTIWTRAYGWPTSERAYAAAELTDGGFILAGSVYTGQAYDIVLVRTTAGGDTVWTRRMGGIASDEAYGVLTASDGGIIVGGSTRSTGAGGSDFYLAKLSAAGQTVWERTYGTAGDEICNALRAGDTDGFILCGSTTAGSDRDVYVVRTDAGGTPLWSRAYPQSGLNAALSVVRMANNDFVLAGYTSAVAGMEELYLMAVRGTDGDTLQTRTVATPGHTAIGYDVARSGAGGFIVCGMIRNTETANRNIIVLQFGADTSGTVAGTVRAYPSDETVAGVRVWAEGWMDTLRSDSRGQYFLRLPPGRHTVHFERLHYCSEVAANVPIIRGEITQRDILLHSPVASISVSSINAAALVGSDYTARFTISNPGGYCPLEFTVRDTSDWIDITPDAGAVPVDGTTEIQLLLRGSQLTVGDWQSVLTVSYPLPGSPVLIPVLFSVYALDAPETAALPREVELLANYPNPFNPTTHLMFALPAAQVMRLAVYDATGRQTAVLAEGFYPAGFHRAAFDGGALPSGVYFARLETANALRTQKMILLK